MGGIYSSSSSSAAAAAPPPELFCSDKKRQWNSREGKGEETDVVGALLGVTLLVCFGLGVVGLYTGTAKEGNGKRNTTTDWGERTEGKIVEEGEHRECAGQIG